MKFSAVLPQPLSSISDMTVVKLAALWSLLLAGAPTAWCAEGSNDRPNPISWIEPMRHVHARFNGTNGTFAHFGDSITFTMAFWTPLAGQPRNMNAELQRAHESVKRYMRSECWSQWKGPEFGNNGSMTIRWAHDNVEKWLRKLNPETVLIMFGSNDVG